MPTLEQRVADLEKKMTLAYGVASAFQGRQADATLALPHNDSWLFEDNVDATHPANLRYIIAANTQRIVSARLSIHLAPYRTYNSLSLTATGTESTGHTHGSAAHNHNLVTASGAFSDTIGYNGAGNNTLLSASAHTDTTAIASATPGATGGESGTHTHTVSGSAVLGVTEGAVATGVTLSFDGGPDVSPNFGGPFTVDQIELNVAPYLVSTIGVWHTIAMQPNGLGRIEAHLRLGVFVSAAQPI